MSIKLTLKKLKESPVLKIPPKNPKQKPGKKPQAKYFITIKKNKMDRQKFSKELYNFICENYQALEYEYSILPENARIRIPFAGFCIIFWDDLQDLAKNSQKTVNPDLN